MHGCEGPRRVLPGPLLLGQGTKGATHVKGPVLLATLVMFPVVAVGQTQCVTGRPCGHTCIAVHKTCHIERPAYAPPDSTPVAAESVRAEPGEGMAWVASSRGEVYYRHGCGNVNRIAPENRVYFRTEEEAKRAGYRRSGAPGC